MKSFLVLGMPPLPLAPRWAKIYPACRVLLYAVFGALVLFLAIRSLFPTVSHSFDFRNPHASRNQLMEPRDEQGHSLENGQLAQATPMLLNTGTSGMYHQTTFSAAIDDRAEAPQVLEFSLRRGYRAAWLPEGSPLADFPQEDLYVATEDGVTTYYALRDGAFYRFVSEDAYLSRFPKERAKMVDPAFIRDRPLASQTLGFRPGLLVAFADGIFVIADEAFMRPIGSARIFLASGYRFEDVKQVNAEELGIYKRGPIFLSGDIHPSGTLFQNTDTGTYFLLDGGMRHDLPPSAYRDFLLSQVSPIPYSSIDSKKTIQCSAKKPLIGPFACSAPLGELAQYQGNDYEITVHSPESATELRTLSAGFQTEKSQRNLLFILSREKDSLLARFGLTEPR